MNGRNVFKLIIISFVNTMKMTPTIPHISSELQIADLFTKAMSCDCRNFLVSKLMLDDPHHFKGECKEYTESGRLADMISLPITVPLDNYL